MADLALYAVVAAWMVAGVTFWIGCLRQSLPEGWRFARHHRAPNGWCDELFVMLPVCLIGGPLWWLAFIYVRSRQRGRRHD